MGSAARVGLAHPESIDDIDAPTQDSSRISKV
jgi:hypothetical protein